MSAPTLVEWAKASQAVLQAIVGEEPTPLEEILPHLDVLAAKSTTIHGTADAITTSDVAQWALVASCLYEPAMFDAYVCEDER